MVEVSRTAVSGRAFAGSHDIQRDNDLHVLDWYAACVNSLTPEGEYHRSTIMENERKNVDRNNNRSGSDARDCSLDPLVDKSTPLSKKSAQNRDSAAPSKPSSKQPGTKN